MIKLLNLTIGLFLIGLAFAFAANGDAEWAVIEGVIGSFNLWMAATPR